VTTILPENIACENETKVSVLHFLKEHHVGKLLRQCNIRKTKGIPCFDLVQFLILLVFSGKNMFRMLSGNKTDLIGFSKDSIYRFLNNCHYNWRKFLLLLSSSIIRNRIVPLSSEQRGKQIC